MNHTLTHETIEILMSLIRDLILTDPSLIEEFSSILKEDMINASKLSDVRFINLVIVPILKAEETCNVTISVIEEEALAKQHGRKL